MTEIYLISKVDFDDWAYHEEFEDICFCESEPEAEIAKKKLEREQESVGKSNGEYPYFVITKISRYNESGTDD